MKRRTCLLALTFLACGAGAQQSTAPVANAARIHSRMMIFDLATGLSKVIYEDDGVWEAPNWSPDGKYLIANSNGRIYRIDLTLKVGSKPEPLLIPMTYQCNNDKVLSPDGRLLGFSATRLPDSGSEVYVANADGFNIREFTHAAPWYFHGWSPDGRTMAFVGQRNGSGQFDIYSVPMQGGSEKRLTSDAHHDDGPDYSPDGRWIYINSNRSGQEAIWRIPAATGAGANDAQAERVFADGAEDWFPHVSPDGRRLLYIAYPAGTPTHDPRDLAVELRLAVLSNDKVSGQPQTIVRLRGGQGSLNVNSWAPDSTHFAYVDYQKLP